MKNLYFTGFIFLFFLFLTFNSFSQTASTTVTYSGFQACGGCTVCGADYWCVGIHGSYCGDVPNCDTRTFFDPVPPGNVVTNVTLNYWTASCAGAAINGSINGFSVPTTWDGAGGCLCSNSPCALTTSTTGNYPCGMPGYVYGGNNSMQICVGTGEADPSVCFSRVELIFTYVLPDVITPNITPSGPTSFCPGGSVTLNAGSGYSAYNWSTGETTQSIIASSTNTYSVSVTSVTGCTTGSSSEVVTVNPLPTPAITGALAYCAGSNTILNAGAYSSFIWSTGENTQTIAATTGNNPFSVTVTDINGCTGISSSVNVSENVLPTPAITGTLDYCAGSNTTLDAGAYSLYAWSTGASTQATTATTANNPVSVTVTDANGCSGITSVNISENALPTPAITGALTYCAGYNSTLDAGVYSSYIWSTGATTQTITATAANNPVTVTVTDANGCTGVSSIVNVSEAASLSPTIAGALAYCAGYNSTLDAGVYSTYIWSTGETSQTIVATIANNPIAVTVTDINGCTGSSSVSIIENALPTSVITGPLAYCAGLNTTLDAGIYSTYIWSTGATSQTITATTVNNPIAVTVTDINGCTGISGIVSVTENELPTPAITGALTYCVGYNSTLDAGAYSSYIWSTGATSQTITATTSDNPIAVTVTDVNGCIGISAIINVSEAASFIPTIAGTLTYCAGLNTTLDAGAYSTYIWSTGETTQIIAATTVNNPIAVTVTDANGCTGTASVDVTQNDLPTPAITGSLIYCSGLNTTLDAGTYPSYQWSTGATTQTIVATTANNPIVVTVTDANGCSATSGVSVTEATILQITGFVNQSICIANNGSAYVVVSGGTPNYTYLWTGGSVNDSLNGLAPGSYTVTVTDANSCTSTYTATIINASAGIMQILNHANVACYSGQTGSISVSLQGGTAPFIYNWNNGGSTATISNLAAGMYSVTITDFYGCQSDTLVTITQPTGLNLSADKINATCGNANGSAWATVSGGVTPYHFNWSNLAINDTIHNLYSGNYFVTVTDTLGCSVDTFVNINNLVGPALNITHTNVSCYNGNNGTATVITTGGFPPFTYSWSGGLTPNSSTTSGLLAGLFVVTVIDSNNCSSISSVTVTQPALLSASISAANNVSCFGYSDGTATASVIGGMTPYSFNWSNGDSVATTDSLSGGVYFVTVTDNNNCTTTANTTITESNIVLTAQLSTDSAKCFGSNDGSANIIGNGGIVPYTFIWSTDPIQTGSSAVLLKADYYCVTVTDVNLCHLVKCDYVKQPSKINIDSLVTPTSCEEGDDGVILVHASGGKPPYLFHWFTDPVLTDSVVNGLFHGSYDLKITDSRQCSQLYTLEVPNTPVPCLVIPTVFTPNGDGIHDLWNIKNLHLYPNAVIAVFNRWGSLLYQAGTSDKRWDGFFNGAPCPNGSYVFIINLNDGTEAKQGIVTIIR